MWRARRRRRDRHPTAGRAPGQPGHRRRLEEALVRIGSRWRRRGAAHRVHGIQQRTAVVGRAIRVSRADGDDPLLIQTGRTTWSSRAARAARTARPSRTGRGEAGLAISLVSHHRPTGQHHGAGRSALVRASVRSRVAVLGAIVRRSAPIALFALLGCLLVSCTSSTAGAGVTPSIAGRWSVTYGAPTVVTISVSGHSSYTMTGARGVAVLGDHCRLRVGTLLARFTGTGGTYTGRHGLWDESTCAFVRWTTLRLTLAGNTASARLGDGEAITYTRRGAAPVPTANGTSWLWLVPGAAVVLIAVLVWAYARRRRQSAASSALHPSI